MAFARLHGIILAAVRSIHLQPRARGITSRHQFLAGPRIVVEWWTTWKTVSATERLAHLAKTGNPSLACADQGGLADLFIECLRGAVTDESLFDTQAVVSRKVPTLYDCIVVKDRSAFAELIHRRWLDLAATKIVNWLVLVPLESVDAIAGHVDSTVQILPATDTAEWRKLSNRYPGLVDLDVATGRLANGLTCFSGGTPQKSFIWLGFETRGFSDQARIQASEATKTFLSVAFAAAAGSNPYLFTKTGWSPTDRCVRFADTSDGIWTHAPIGTLMPSIGGTLTISAERLNQIRAWYGAARNCGGQIQRRAATASQFLHQALLGHGTQQFISYFIVLDGLFGEKGTVEQKIISGVTRVGLDKSWERRCRLLFKLRSALVHGEVSDIRSWRELPTYWRLFHSQPLADVQKLALKALYQYPFVI
jgi:hypothetical protein